MTRLEHVHCSQCGKKVSGVDPELGLVVRAYVQCPECLATDAGCINCSHAFEKHEARHYFGQHDQQVGPFCAACDQTIKVHTKFAETAGLLKATHAAYHALKSYQYGNAAPDLAAECTELLVDAIVKAEDRA